MWDWRWRSCCSSANRSAAGDPAEVLREPEVLETNAAAGGNGGAGKCGERTAIFELQGSLFFGTTDQLYTDLEAELKKRDYIVLDMRRVQSVDLTAAHMLEQVEDMMSERNGT